MKKNDFNKNVFILEQEKSKTVLYNSYTGEISKIDSKLSEINLSENTELKNYLEENYFLQKRNNVPISSHIENTRKELSATKRSASFTIHLTYSCNCKCFYCYQNDIKSSLRMDEKTEEKLYNFFEKVLEKNILESVSFIFIGGEPLICMDLMLRIREKTEKIFTDIKKFYSIITNGCLLSEKNISSLSKYKWNYIQVTLDGSKELHDTIRIKKITQELSTP